MIWKLRTRILELGRMPLMMGIVNLTPDSFSDGGRFYRNGKPDVSAVVDFSLKLVEEGADILDIGAESTRPGATPIGIEEELKRLLPVLEMVLEKTNVSVSVDTYRAEVAREAIAAGAEIINDISAGTYDPDILAVVQRTGAGICLMHSLGTPETMQQAPNYNDVVAEVAGYLAERKNACLQIGIRPEKIVLDPGIGFGKNVRHNQLLLQNAESFHKLGSPLLYGVSRKRFIDGLSGQDHAHCPENSPEKRLPGTIAACLSLMRENVQILRVHDVAEIRQAMQVFDRCRHSCSNSSNAK